MSFSTEIFICPEGENFHWHDYHQLAVGLEGSFEIETEERDVTINMVQGCILPAGKEHYYRAKEEGFSLIINLAPEDPFLINHLKNQNEQLTQDLFRLPRYFVVDNSLRMFLKFAGLELKRSHNNKTLEQNIASTLFNCIHSRLISSPVPPGTINLAQLDQYIENNLSSKLSVQELALHVGMSPSYFHARFKEETGFTPLQYVIERRLSKAYELLTGTEISIVDIAFQTGFGSQSAFNHAFKAKYKLTPGNLRKNIGGK